MVTMETVAKERRKPGPVPGVPTMKCTVLLPPALADWGKAQPGGLSELMRRLLEAERVRLGAAPQLVESD
jgi:hypothetical protein